MPSLLTSKKSNIKTAFKHLNSAYDIKNHPLTINTRG